MISVPEQWQIFLALGGAGLVLAFIGDCYRVGRYFWRPGLPGTYIGDTLFWLVFTALTFILLMAINWGEVRAYVFLGLGWGFFLYFLFLSRGVRRGLYAGGRILAGLVARGCHLLKQTVVVVVIPARLLLATLLLPLLPFRILWRRPPPGGPPADGSR
jgi:spore cortex biosynthesis protein YabQ